MATHMCLPLLGRNSRLTLFNKLLMTAITIGPQCMQIAWFYSLLLTKKGSMSASSKTCCISISSAKQNSQLWHDSNCDPLNFVVLEPIHALFKTTYNYQGYNVTQYPSF